MTIKPPLPDQISAPIVHKIRELYKLSYQIGKQIPKRDRFNLWQEVEKVIIKSLDLAIEASLNPPLYKNVPLKQLRIEIEKTKHLIRVVYEVKVIKDNVYFDLQIPLQEISKMTNGWLKYLETKKEPDNSSLW